MNIVETYSHQNGLEFLIVHKNHLWEEIEEVVASVDAEACKTKVSKEKSKQGTLLYSPVELNARFAELLKARNWDESRARYWMSRNEKLIRRTLSLSPEEQKIQIEATGETPVGSYNQTDFVKDRVAIEVQFGKYSFVAYDMFVKHMAFYVGDQIDVGIEILPMKSLQSQMSSGVPYYEKGFYDVVRQGRGVPAVPLVVVGVEP